MPFQRPSLADLVDRVQNDFVSRLTLSGPPLRRSVVYVVGRVLAGAAHMLHGHLEWASKQTFPDQSDAESLIRQGNLYGVPLNPPTFASGSITVTGTNGATIGTDEKLIRSDGVEYQTTAGATVASGTATVPVVALVAADAGNCATGTQLSFESPDAGVNVAAVVASPGLAGGADAETTDAYRLRVKARMSDPPHGGDADDYVAWALQVSGVTRAWCYPRELGAGTVTVRFMRDNDVTQIPDSGAVAAVQTYINGLRPVTATVTVAAPVAAPVAVSVHIVPDTPDIRAAVVAELADLLAREATPGATLPISQVRTAIGIAEGVTDYTLTVPGADVTHTTGQIATLGTVTFV